MGIRTAAIIGTGAVGSALARNLVQHGLDVRVTGRDADKAGELAKSLGSQAQSVPSKDIARGADILFLAVPAVEAAPALASAGATGQTIVVDCTNPLTWNAGPVHAPPEAGSITAELARQFPQARLVKAFNTFGAEFHADARLGAARADLYLAGDDAEARRAVAELAQTLGFDPVDVGPLRNARHLESLAILWIHLATVGGRGRETAFKLLHR